MIKGEEQIKLTPSDFVHLHNHTNYSILDGLTRMDDLCQMVKDHGMTAVAVTDHGTISGWIDLYSSAKNNDIKPIFGLEAYVAARKHTDRDPAKDKERFHITLIAMNNIGYENIMRLSSTANLNGMYYKPRVDHELLEKYNEGIICLSGCAGGEVSMALRNGNYNQAKELAEWYKKVFADRYYIELQDHGHPDSPKYWEIQSKVNEGLLKIAKELNIPAVVTCDAHYLKASDVAAHEILLCVGTGSFLSESVDQRMSLEMFDLHVIEPEKIIERWGKEYPELVLNSKRIADRCNVELNLGGILIPTFQCPEGFNEKTFLHKLVWDGLARRYGVAPENKGTDEKTARKLLPKDISERADYELGVIDSMGFNGYFLIVQDFINWGKDQGIVFGPGRGSAAGSIIAYALKITDLDPLKYDLLFERFLNPDRISMPDIDIDIQDTRRDEVIAYCTEKYGADRVANICTFGKMMAKNAVRDVARVLEVPYAESDRLSKLIPALNQGRHVPLSDSVERDQDLHREYETNGSSKRVIDFAMQLEGTIRSHGVHAAGVVIAPDELVKYVPLEMSQKGVVATQFPMGPIEDLGLLKMDFLGLSNLTIINNALRIVRKVYKKEIDLSSLPMDDVKTYELFQRGDTTGVFQLESAGMKRYLKELKPTEFDDIIAMVALYRPGPMSEIPKFIARKHGKEKITYYEEHMKPALENTYGILVYQEQFMQISKEVCGFTGGEADTLRKAVGKKKIDLMKQMKDKLIEGGIKNSGADRAKMEAFWNHLEEFANYCFNKSHAACYAMIAYWTAYIKAHYPSAFMAALMTSDSDDTDRLSIEIAECKYMGIKVLLPDINESFVDFAIVPETGDIRFGLSAVKGVGETVVEEIEKVRKVEKFTSLEDYAKRVNSRLSNRRVWENLIKSGAFDQFQNEDGFPDRSDLLFNIEQITEFSRKIQSEVASGQGSLFDIGGVEDMASLKIVPAPQKYSEKEQLTWERELLGLYLSAHPLDKYDTYFIEQTNPISSLTSDMDGAGVMIGGLVSVVRTIVTKSGSKMAFLTVEDKTGQIDVVVFSKLYEDFGEQLVADAVLKIEGRVSGRDRDGNKTPDPSVVANSLIIVTDSELDNYQSTGQKMAEPKVSSKSDTSKFWQKNGGSSKKQSNQPSADQKKELNQYDYRPAAIISQTIYIHIKDPNNSKQLVDMKKKINEYEGSDNIMLVLGDSKKDMMKLPFTTSINEKLVDELKGIIGEDCVVVK